MCVVSMSVTMQVCVSLATVKWIAIILYTYTEIEFVHYTHVALAAWVSPCY